MLPLLFAMNIAEIAMQINHASYLAQLARHSRVGGNLGNYDA